MTRVRLFVLGFLVLVGGHLMAQENGKSSSIQVGESVFTLNRFYNYRVRTFSYAQEWKIVFLGFKSRFYVQPQVNRIYHIDDNRTNLLTEGWEAGISPGLEFELVDNEHISLYFGGAIGPHYVSASHSRQKTGFLLSEWAHVSLGVKLSDKTSFLVNTGYRHLSNANWKTLNGGVDTWHLRFGLRMAY